MVISPSITSDVKCLTNLMQGKTLTRIFSCHFQVGTQNLALNCPATAMQTVPVGNASTVTVNFELPVDTITGGIQPYKTFFTPFSINVGQTRSVVLLVVDSSNPPQFQQCRIQVTAPCKYF